jgi:protein gp37
MQLAKLPVTGNLADQWRVISSNAPAEEEEQPVPVPEYITLPMWSEMADDEKHAALHVEKSGKVFNDQKDKDEIEWALWSWNPVTGCEHNCPYCYARDIAHRFYEPGFEPSLWPARLLAPQNTRFPEAKAAEWMGHKNVFTCSMADLFGRWVPREWIDAVLDACRAAPQWNFLFLTKFPIRMAEFDFPDNAWVGTTVDCQARVANAERAFRKVNASVKWLSCEPLIEPLIFEDLGAFDWVVLGGASESTQTPSWRPPRAWVNAIEEEAERLGVKVYEKSNLLARTRQYPGLEDEGPTVAPEELVYLPAVEPGKGRTKEASA